MQGIKAKVSKGVQTETMLKCADNTGAKVIQIMSVKCYKGVKGRQPKAGVGDVVVGTVIEGSLKMKHEVVQAVIIRQKKEYMRPDGTRIKFDDNAAIILDTSGKKTTAKGTWIKGAIAKEVLERFPPIGKIASIVV